MENKSQLVTNLVKMDDFCGNSSFWVSLSNNFSTGVSKFNLIQIQTIHFEYFFVSTQNSNLTWYTDNPDFTPCFEQTVLTWIPCGFLWLLSAFSVVSTLRIRTNQRIPTTLLIIFKCLGSWALVIVHITNLSFSFRHEKNGLSVSAAERSSSILKIATYLITFVLLMLHKAKGVRTSGVLFIFWLLTTICEVFPFQTVLRQEDRADDQDKLNFQIQVINFPIVVIMLFLNCWADAAPEPSHTSKEPIANGSSSKENGIALTSSTEAEVTYNFAPGETPTPKTEKVPCPENHSSYLSKLVFFWFESLAWKGWRKPLVYEDLWELNEEDLSKVQYPIFAKNWNEVKEQNKGKPVSVFKVLVKTFGPLFLSGAALKLVQDCLTFVPPRILRLLINFVGNPEEENWKGYLYVGILFCTSIIQTIFLAQYFHKMFILGMRIKASLTGAIYRKALKISNAARKESTVGEIVNLMSVDTQRLMDLVAYLNMVWSAPLQIIVSLYFLWETLGPSVLAGVAVMILMIPINGWLTGKVKTLHIQQMKNKDGRVKLMSEILSGIKVIKLYACKLVHSIRRKKHGGGNIGNV